MFTLRVIDDKFDYKETSQNLVTCKVISRDKITNIFQQTG